MSMFLSVWQKNYAEGLFDVVVNCGLLTGSVRMAHYDSVFRSMYHICETIGSGAKKTFCAMFCSTNAVKQQNET